MIPKNNQLPLDVCRRGWEWLLGWIYPNVCQVCKQREAGKPEGYVCKGCREEPGALKYVEEPFCNRCGLPYYGQITESFICGNCGEMELFFRKARAAVRWTPFVREIIHAYKYERALWHEPFLAELLISRARLPLENESWDMIVPIPLHPSRERRREFNQADRLGRQLSKATGIPLRLDIVKRVGQTKTQTRLSWKERAENVKQAFAARPKADCAGANIVLIDDVLTTGSTANACARVLMDHGAACVDVWTVARGVME
ncbi:MAG: double zinc ribbon domain-containing protein [Verrucomicrobiales bacterium]